MLGIFIIKLSFLLCFAYFTIEKQMLSRIEKVPEKFFEKNKKSACIFEKYVLLYPSRKDMRR